MQSKGFFEIVNVSADGRLSERTSQLKGCIIDRFTWFTDTAVSAALSRICRESVSIQSVRSVIGVTISPVGLNAFMCGYYTLSILVLKKTAPLRSSDLMLTI